MRRISPHLARFAAYSFFLDWQSTTKLFKDSRTIKLIIAKSDKIQVDRGVRKHIQRTQASFIDAIILKLPKLPSAIYYNNCTSLGALGDVVSQAAIGEDWPIAYAS